MKRAIFMYLFFFAMLFVIFQYMNEKKIFGKQENKIESQRNKINKLKDQVKVITDSLESLSNVDYFSLQGNENAISYIESLGFEALEIETFVSDYIYDLNLKK